MNDPQDWLPSFATSAILADLKTVEGSYRESI